MTYFGDASLTLYQVTYVINCDTATLYLSGSDVGITYEVYRNGVYDGQSQLGTGSPLTFTVNTNGNYTIRATNGAKSRFMSGIAEISTIPSIDSVTNDERCGPGSVTLSATATPQSATIYWYTQPSGGSSVGSGSSYTTPTLYNTTNYYVEAQTSPNCASPRRQVTATIHDIPTVNPITHD